MRKVIIGVLLVTLSLSVPTVGTASTDNNSQVNMTELVIEAQDFTISLQDVGTLTVETVMDENHAQVSARLGLALIQLYPTVNEAEFNLLESATTSGEYPLTFYAEHVDGQHVQKTITVSVIGGTEIIYTPVLIIGGILVTGIVLLIIYFKRR